MNTVFLSLGTNSGNKLQNIYKALSEIENKAGKIISISDIYETEPWGFESDNFYNLTIKLITSLSPFDLLKTLKNIEKILGRKPKKSENYEPRPIDIDILFFGDLILFDKNLQIPHKLLHKRMFVLKPMSDLEPEFKHPLLEKSISDLLEHCNDKNKIIRKISIFPLKYV